MLHIPQDDSAGNVRFLADQMREMAAFVSRITGRALDDTALRKSVENSNRACGVIKEIFELAGRVPSPVASRDLSNFGIVMPLFFGSGQAIAIAEAYRDEFTKRIDAGDDGTTVLRVRSANQIPVGAIKEHLGEDTVR